MPSLFDEFLKPWSTFFDMPNSRLFDRMFNVPPVNIMEYKTDFRIFLAAPGFKKEDFHIDLENNMLTIRVEKEEQFEEAFQKFTKNEYNFYNFTRTFTLPENIKIDTVEAKYEDGVLKIVLPKKEEYIKATTMKQIAVK